MQYHAYLHYNDLKQHGIVTKVTAEFEQNRIPPHVYRYQFSTVKGETIYRSGKIGSQGAKDALIKFNEEYKNLQVIYNPDKPEDFWKYYSFINYPKNRNQKLFINMLIGTLVIMYVLQIPIGFIFERFSKKQKEA
ncbi:hypothetical protein GXP67_14065 [Rhodocytophaga rosea]|uniref:DUF3592 domain-containing protein n=1 Tax=Rhodocytophaga rosea TaxID=2704465 RepID=A0A6C0GID6_9BACT|nr:hypothetical protein [Rhodocytophaga rosea]QHT67675.1 hypothetical protein GXP67_14065 [Rhodocytophaga rosea]